jgi:hypothetical protein
MLAASALVFAKKPVGRVAGAIFFAAYLAYIGFLAWGALSYPRPPCGPNRAASYIASS